MPNRYSMNVRPIWGNNEPTFGESVSKGIGGMIELYLRNKEAQTNWENDVRMKGGTVDPTEGVGEKVRRIGGAIRRRLPGYNPVPEAEANLDRNRGVLEPQVTAHDIPREGDYDAPIPGGVVPIRGPRNASMDTRATARDGVTRSPIADAIERTIIKSPVSGYGNSAIVPTARGQRQQELEDQLPLVYARSGAVERERLETMRGDNAIKLEQERQRNRLTLEDDKQAARRDLERVKAAKAAGGLTEYQRRRLDIEEKNAEARLEALGVAIDRTLVGERTPEGLDRTIASRDPTEAARIAATDQSKQAARGRLTDTRKKVQTYSTDPAIARAQHLWDDNPSIQKVRQRPQ